MNTHRVVDLARVHQAMAQARLDAVIVNSPANVWYLSGYPLALSGLQGRGYGRNAAVVVPASGEPILVPGQFEEQISRARAWATDIEPFSDYVIIPVVAAAEIIRRRGLPHRRLGVELAHLSERFNRALREDLPQSDLVPADEMLDLLRAVKSPTEIEGIETALQRSARGAMKALAGVRAGEREVDVHNRLTMEVVRTLWSEKVDGSVLSGPRISIWNGQVSDRTLGEGDWVRLDYVCASSGYPARLCRMGTVGRASSSQVGLYNRYVTGVQGALQQLVSGLTGAEVQALFMETLAENQVRLVEGAVGYGLGYGPVERPFLAPSETWRLTPGMVLSIEPRTVDGLLASWLVAIGEKVSRIVETEFPADRLFAI